MMHYAGQLSPFQSVKNQIISKPKFKVVNRYLPFTKKRLASIVADKEVFVVESLYKWPGSSRSVPWVF